MNASFNEIKSIYFELAAKGYSVIRDFHAYNENVRFCYYEADLHHNELDLLSETNVKRHEYYLKGERGLYLKKIVDEDNKIAASVAVREYFDLWGRLEQIFDFKDDEIDGLMQKVQLMAKEFMKSDD